LECPRGAESLFYRFFFSPLKEIDTEGESKRGEASTLISFSLLIRGV